MEKKHYFYWGLTAFLTVCALMVFYDTVFRNGVLLNLLRVLLHALKPVIYGAVLAYLLAPMVNFFDRLILRVVPPARQGALVRAGSILLTLTVVFYACYVLFNMLIPQLYQSVVTLIGNMQSYYKTVYAWTMKLLDDNPRIAAVVFDAADKYWGEVTKWFTGTFLPQARQTIGALTSGVLSVLFFFKDLFIGVIVSIYLLALKEKFVFGAKRLLYSWTDQEMYRNIVKSLAQANTIFSGFIRGKLLDSLIIGVLCFIGASILRLPYTPLVSVIVGVTNVVPYFGPVLGTIPSAFLILLVNPVQCLYFLIFILILQQLDGNLIGPKILGGSTKLPSFWVIVAILIGGGFFGVLGMFLGVPVFACLRIIANYYTEKRLLKKGGFPEDDAAAAVPETKGEST